MVWETGARGEIEEDSPSWRAFTGQSTREWLEEGWLEAVHPADRDDAEKLWRESLENRGRIDAELRIRRADGVYSWMNVRTAPLIDKEGALVKWVGMGIDISEYKQAEEALRESEDRLRRMINVDVVAILMLDASGTLLDANDAFFDMFGYGRDEVLRGDVNWRDFTAPEQIPDCERQMQRLIETGRLEPREKRFVRKDGSGFWLAYAASSLGDGVYIEYCIDITARREAEEALRKSELKYRTLLETTDEGFCVIEIIEDEQGRPIDFRYIETNPAFDRHTGLGAVAGMTVRELVPEIETRWIERFAKIARTGESRRFVDHSSALGQWFEADAFLAGPPEERRVAIIFRDVSSRVEAEEALRESEERFRLAAEAVNGVIYEQDLATGRVQRSTGLTDVLGYSPDEVPPTAEWWRERVHPDDLEQLRSMREQMETEEYLETEYRTKHRDGHWVHVWDQAVVLRDENGDPVRVVGFVVDITERKIAEEQREILLAELSHRVKNMLATVSSIAAQMARSSDSLEEFTAAFFGRLKALAEAHSLLAGNDFSRAKLDSIIRKNLKLYCADVDRTCSLEGPDITISSSNVTALTLVFHELTTNAVKYGALSRPDGRIQVEWRLTGGGDDGREIELVWRETGGPPARPPERAGFGSDLISQEIEFGMDGAVEMEFSKSGLVCKMKFTPRPPKSPAESGGR